MFEHPSSVKEADEAEPCGDEPTTTLELGVRVPGEEGHEPPSADPMADVEAAEAEPVARAEDEAAPAGRAAGARLECGKLVGT